jgi:hypothetical protein
MRHPLFFYLIVNGIFKPKRQVNLFIFSNNCKSAPPNTSTWYIQSKFNKFLDTALTLKITKWDLINIIVGL